MSSELENFLISNNFNPIKKDLMFQVSITSHNDIIKLLSYGNSSKVPIFYNYSEKPEIKNLPKVEPFMFLIFKNFNEIMEVSIENRFIIVQPGVKAKKLNALLKKENFTFLSSSNEDNDLNIGQMIFKNVIGKNNSKTSDSILGLEVILANGELIRTGSKTLKSVSGYDTTSLFIGSQGIFGIVIKIILRVDPKIEESTKKPLELLSDEGFNEGELEILRKLKKVLDPNNILNPNCLIQ